MVLKELDHIRAHTVIRVRVGNMPVIVSVIGAPWEEGFRYREAKRGQVQVFQAWKLSLVRR